MFFLNTSITDYLGGPSATPESDAGAAETTATPWNDGAEVQDEVADEELILLPPSIPSSFGAVPEVMAAAGPLGVRMFEFFVTRLCPNLSYSPMKNPYQEFIIPLSLTSAPLYHAVVSWAANELSIQGGPPSGDRKERFAMESVRHKIKALHGLREEISLAQSDSSHRASVLGTMIILSCNDIVEMCSSSWIAHLRAARVLCGIAWPAGQDRSDSFRRFCLMWFVSHDVMSRTAWIQDTVFDPSEWFAGDDENEIDPITSCSRGLIQQVCNIGTLISDARAGSMASESREPPSASLAEFVRSEPMFSARRDAIEASLKGLSQRVSSYHGRDPTEQVKVAESKRLCSLIYLYSCIDGATPESPVIESLTGEVIGLLAELPSNASLTFSLFVVGTLGVRGEEDRRVILDKFEESVSTRWICSVAKARDVVAQVWLDRDLGRCGRWEDLVETKSRLLSLA